MIWALEVNVNREAKAALKAAEQEAKRLAEAAAREAAEAAREGAARTGDDTKERGGEAWGAGPRPRPLTIVNWREPFELLRNGQDVHVESLMSRCGRSRVKLGQTGRRSRAVSPSFRSGPKFNQGWCV